MRNRYLDLLRAAAIVRVIVYHLFGWPWLSIVLPAMGVMFALAGSLTAGSLDKRNAVTVVTSRLRRLLPPVWLLGLLAVPVMLAFGWAHEDGEHPFSPSRLLFWILPVGEPPGSDKGIDVWEPLWYIRAYLWFVVLSPVLYLAYRKLGWLAVLAPIGMIAVLDWTGFSLSETADAALWDFVTYGACWIAGFAHHDGRLTRTRPWAAMLSALVLGAAAMYWLAGHQGEDPWDLNDVSESQALWSLAFVLLVLRWQPPMGWLARVRPLDRAVTLLNGRAVTIYLWHNLAIAAVWPVLTVLALDDLDGLNGVVDLITALLLTAGAVLAFGWAEDLAARRRPRLWPVTDPPRAARPEPPGDAPSAARPARSGTTHPRQPGPTTPRYRTGVLPTIDGPAPNHGPAFDGPAFDPANATERPIVEFGLATDPDIAVSGAPPGQPPQQRHRHPEPRLDRRDGSGDGPPPAPSRPGAGPPAPGPPAPGPPTLGQPAPGQPAPDQSAPGQSAPGQSAPGRSAPGQPAPSQPAPGPPAPGPPGPGRPSTVPWFGGDRHLR